MYPPDRDGSQLPIVLWLCNRNCPDLHCSYRISFCPHTAAVRSADRPTAAFLSEHGVAVSTARAGNVIGGGDFSVDRIIPDCIRAVQAGTAIQIRNPFSVRPYQHVLEPLNLFHNNSCSPAKMPEFAAPYNQRHHYLQAAPLSIPPPLLPLCEHPTGDAILEQT